MFANTFVFVYVFKFLQLSSFANVLVCSLTGEIYNPVLLFSLWNFGFMCLYLYIHFSYICSITLLFLCLFPLVLCVCTIMLQYCCYGSLYLFVPLNYVCMLLRFYFFRLLVLSVLFPIEVFSLMKNI